MTSGRKYQRKFVGLGFEASPRVAFFRAPNMQRADVGKGVRVPKPATAFKPEGLPPEVDHDASFSSGHIRCPSCSWKPDKQSRWFCISMGAPENFSNGCGHGWNTFDTRGQCPGCKHQWRHTTCLSCSKTNLHDDWYMSGSGGNSP